MSAPPVRVAQLVSHPIQYFVPLYRELARRAEIELAVYFYSDETVRGFYDPEFGRELSWDVDLLGGYDARFLPSSRRTDAPSRFLRRPNWDIVAELASRPPDVLWISGYAHLTAWLAATVARSRRSRVLLRDDQTLLHGRPLHKRLAKHVALRALFSQSYGLYTGEENRRYLARYGIPPERLFPARHCVDNDFFAAQASALAGRREELRAAFGVTDDAPVVLFCGKFIPKKQPLLLVEAFADVRRNTPCWLLLAGDGPLRPEVEARVEALSVPGVRLAGFLNQSEIGAAYTAADVFVLPSRLHETWGLVVNEAMNFSLPIVVSDKVGCAADLVRPGWNGFVVDHRSRSELADALATLVADPQLRRVFGGRSRSLVAEYSVEACADGIVAACLAATGRTRSTPAERAAATPASPA